MTDTKKKYYLGGYYLTILRPKKLGTNKEAFIYTCSECVNDNLVDVWSYSWTLDKGKQAEEAKDNFKISDAQINSLRTWVDKCIYRSPNSNRIQKHFFSHLSRIKLMALYFDEDERRRILEEFQPQSKETGEIGLRLTLLKSTEESDDEKFLGFDYIGIEIGGSFHTFHCHDIGQELVEKFSLSLNSLGLFESDKNSKQVLDYLNDENNGYEPVPWFIEKIKLVTTE